MDIRTKPREVSFLNEKEKIDIELNTQIVALVTFSNSLYPFPRILLSYAPFKESAIFHMRPNTSATTTCPKTALLRPKGNDHRSRKPVAIDNAITEVSTK
jgi:hypothetical protein